MRNDMRRVLTRMLAALALAAIGTLAAATYADITVPIHRLSANWAAALCACTIADLSVVRSAAVGAGALQLTAVVHAGGAASTPLAVATNFVNVGGMIQVPITLLAMLVTWPAGSNRECIHRAALAVPALLLLEVATTGLQLVAPLLALGAELQWADEPDWLTGWSGFLESGGRVALAAIAGLLVIGTAASRFRQMRRSAPV